LRDGTATPIALVDGGVSGYTTPSVAVSGGNVYWTSGQANGIWRTPLADGGATDSFVSTGNPSSIAADATSLYWLDKGAAAPRQGASTAGIVADGQGNAYVVTRYIASCIHQSVIVTDVFKIDCSAVTADP
jgi:hypothetical protein